MGTEAAVTDAPAADTTATEVTDAPVDTTTEVTDAPVETDASGNMPSATAQPDGCVSWDYAPAGFENEVSYCVSGGMVFLDGHSTCIPASGDASEVNASLESSWNNNWYFGASQKCTGRDSDATTDDQLWVTNKMCDNLETDIASAEASVTNYMDGWKSDVTDLVNANMVNFDADTQSALQALLDQINGN